MELSSPIGGFIYPVAFLVVLTIVVFFHELGHFLVARWFNVKVDAFSIGFGKEIFGRTDKHGTRWKVSILPLGGYVKFTGDLGPASIPDRDKLEEFAAAARAQGHDPDGLLHFKPLWQRACVVVAGPVANFILGALIYAGVFMYQGDVYIDPVIGSVLPGTAAEEAGFEPGDRILTVSGRGVKSFEKLSMLITMSAGTEIEVVVLRDGKEVTLFASPRRKASVDLVGNKQNVGHLGISARNAEQDIHIVSYGPLSALKMGVYRTGFIIERTLTYMGRMIVGKEDTRQLGGPIRIAKYSGQMAQISVIAVIGMIAILSISVGLINLFPIPLMDGGHLLYYAVEAVRGKPMSERAQEAGFRIGLIFVLSVMVYATWNDLIDVDAVGKISNIFS